MGHAVEKTPKRKHHLGHGYSVGDMIWGKVRSHPWWPGQVFNEAFSPISRKTKREGCVLVAFFGDDTYGWLDPVDIIPFEPNYVDNSRQTNEMAFLDAVEGAEYEVKRRAALGLSCCCKNPSNFRETSVQGILEVDVEGYQPGAIYSRNQIQSATDRFQPFKMLCFLHRLAEAPCDSLLENVMKIRNVALVYAYRMAVFKKYDETNVNAFRLEKQVASISVGNSKQQEKTSPQVRLTGHLKNPETPKRNRSFSKKMIKRDGHLTDCGTSGTRYNQEQVGFLSPAVHHKEDGIVLGDCITQKVGAPSPVVYRSLGHQNATPSDERVNLASNVDQAEITQKVVKSKIQLENTRSSSLVVNHIQVARLSRIADSHGRISEFRDVSNTLAPSGDIFKELPVSNNENMVDNPKLLESEEEKSASKEAAIILGKRTKGGIKMETDFEHACVKANTTHQLSLQTGFLQGQNVVVGKMGRRNEATEAIHLQALDVLLAFARDTSLGLKNAAITLQFFQRFRSFTYRNICCASQGPADSLKPPKKRLRPDACGVAGLGSNNYSSEERSTFKRLKGNDVNSLCLAEKKFTEKLPMSQREKGDKKVTTTKTKHSIEKPAALRMPVGHKMLFMQFPHQSALPSISELKAKFVRFGPFASAPNVSWKFSTCQIVFRRDSDARTAFIYAYQNHSLFGSVNVSCHLRPVERSSMKLSKLPKQEDQGAPEEVPQSRSSVYTEQRTKGHPQQLHPVSHKRSCLKKSGGDGAESITSTAHCLNQFVDLGSNGNKTSPGKHVRVSGHNRKKPNMNDLIARSSISFKAVDNPEQKVGRPPMPPLLPDNGQIQYATEGSIIEACNVQYEPESRDNLQIPPASTSVDISYQMLNLMERCYEIVCSLKCRFGYVPFHL